MFELQSKSVMRGAIVGLACLATPVVAQDRTALVIANSAYPGENALPALRGTALDVSEALLGLGFNVNRLENPTAATLQSALDTVQSADGVSLVYYAGRTATLEDTSVFVPVAGGAGVPIDPLVTGPSDAPRFVFIDMCHDVVAATDAEVDLADDALIKVTDVNLPLSDALSATADETENLFLATSAAPGEPCAFDGEQTMTDVLLDRMTIPGLATDQFGTEDTDPIWLASTLTEPFVFRTATSDASLTADDYAFLETLSPAARDQMIGMWKQSGIAVDIAGAAGVAPTSLAPIASGNNTVVLVAPVRPVSTATLISPIAPRANSNTTTALRPVGGGVTLVAGGAPAPAPAVFRATPGENGLPAPSILVGFVTDEPSITEAPEVTENPVAGSGLSYDDLEARNSMRDEDAVLFASLVESGAFDPPDAELARAIQTELARMNCYRSTIDGLWGPGSRRSVTAYYNEVEGSTPSQDPDARIFRKIIATDDVRCPDPVPVAAAPAPRRATTTQAAPRRAATTQAAPRRATPAPTPAPAAPAAPARRTISQSTGTGAFR